MFCPNCGSELPDDAMFCASCGTKMALDKDTDKIEDTQKPNQASDKNNNDVDIEKKNSDSKLKDIKKTKNKKQFNRKKLIIILVSVGVVILVLSIGFGAYYATQVAPYQKYDNALEQTKNDKNSLENKIKEAEKCVSDNPESSLQDPNTVKQLKDTINHAKEVKDSKSLDTDKPSIEEIDSCISELGSFRDKLNEQSNNLTRDIGSVNKSKQAKTDEAVALKERYNLTKKDNQGYEISTTVKSTSWIKGTEKDKISTAWKNAGGHASVPEISSFNTNSGFKDYSNENCCVIIGCAEFSNKTNNFHISESNKKSPVIDLSLFDVNFANYKYDNDPYKDSKYEFAWKTNYTTGTDSYKTDNIDSGRLSWSYGKTSSYSSGSGEIVRADMQKDTWGPVAFMIVAHNIFSPNFPNGDPKLDNIKVQFRANNSDGSGWYDDTKSDMSFLPGKTW